MVAVLRQAIALAHTRKPQVFTTWIGAHAFHVSTFHSKSIHDGNVQLSAKMLSAGSREKTLLHGGVMYHHHAPLQRAQQSRYRLSGRHACAYCIIGETVDGGRLPHRCSVPLLKHHMPRTGQRNGTPVYGYPPDAQKPIIARRKPSGFHVHRQHGQVRQ